ncbi:MAG: ATPase, T2SS/T4P/T4SS family, partial [Deltaproteobacteria bacterium]|nr:ATPase, T2SS/T4P/T4SS family [Deltaproteobacteria bacterium]
RDNLGLDLGSALIKKGFVTENKLLQFLSHHLNTPFATLQGFEFDPELVHRVPQHVARQHHVIPMSQKGNKVCVAMANPFDSFARDDLKDIFKAEIIPHLASASEIDEALEKFFQEEEGDLKLVTLEVSTESDESGATETRKMQEMALGPKIVTTVNGLLARAFAEKASDIHIEPTRTKVLIRYRVDGLLRDRGSLAKNMHLPVVSRIKILGGLDIAERRIPQDGRVRVLMVGKPLDLRISTCPTQHGEKIVIRLLSKDGVRSIEALGFEDKERKIFSDIISKSHGIFLATGPTGSGKSTTLYAALSRINSSDKNVISIEDPIENEIEGVNQVAVNTKSGLNFAAVLRSVLRQDPDIILIGEIRDAETAQIAVRAAITGHMVLSTLHTNTAVGAISRLNDLGVEPFLLCSALKGLLAQRLVRKICSKCRTETEPDLARWGNLAKVKKAFMGKGCKACNYSGYAGRIGIFELAAVEGKVQEMIHNKATEGEIVKSFRESGVKSILQDGLEKVEKGLTTLEEVMKVTQEE